MLAGGARLILEKKESLQTRNPIPVLLNHARREVGRRIPIAVPINPQRVRRQWSKKLPDVSLTADYGLAFQGRFRRPVA